MKMIMKRIMVILMSVCLLVPCFSLVTYAANGRIMFTDLDATAGDTVSVKGVVQSEGEALGEVQVVMKYDSSAIQFLKGDNLKSDAEGQVTFNGKGNGTETKIEFTMEFKVLKGGEHTINIDSYLVKTKAGVNLQCREGSSKIKAKEGTGPVEPDPVTGGAGSGIKVTVQNKEYELSEGFAESDIPVGFTVGEISYQDTTIKAAVMDSGELKAAYLMDDANKGEFFLYQKDETFAPLELIPISETYRLILLQDDEKIKLPEEYQKVSLTLNGNEFPAWQNTQNGGFYLLYGVNSDGDKGFYQYDSKEGTYQRIDTPESVEKKKDSSFLGKIKDFVNQNFNIAFLGFIVLAVLMLTILIIVSIKLRNRNLELDDFYDKYDNDDGLGRAPAKSDRAQAKKGNKSAFKRNEPIEIVDDEFDDIEEYEEEEDYEEDYDDDDESEDFYDDDDEFLIDIPDYDDIDEEEDDDEDDDGFKVNIIDLD